MTIDRRNYRSPLKISDADREATRLLMPSLPVKFVCRGECRHCGDACGLSAEHDGTHLCVDHAINHHNLYGYGVCDGTECECRGAKPARGEAVKE